jgi:hypothetical protein
MAGMSLPSRSCLDTDHWRWSDATWILPRPTWQPPIGVLVLPITGDSSPVANLGINQQTARLIVL